MRTPVHVYAQCRIYVRAYERTHVGARGRSPPEWSLVCVVGSCVVFWCVFVRRRCVLALVALSGSSAFPGKYGGTVWRADRGCCVSRKETVGEPFYLLVTTLNQKINKGPVDVITCKALYTLNEDWLLWQVPEFSTVVCWHGMSFA